MWAAMSSSGRGVLGEGALESLAHGGQRGRLVGQSLLQRAHAAPIEFLQEARLRGRPDALADGLRIRAGQQVQHAQAFGRIHDAGELADGFGQVQVALAGGLRHQQVVLDEERHFVDFGVAPAELGQPLSREVCACVGVRAGGVLLARVV
jgi:hypothetical protein